jgi:hypothetical protein
VKPDERMMRAVRLVSFGGVGIIVASVTSSLALTIDRGGAGLVNKVDGKLRHICGTRRPAAATPPQFLEFARFAH